MQTDHLILARRPDLIIITTTPKKEKKPGKIVDFAVPADHRIKLKKVKRGLCTSTLLRNWKKLSNMKMTIMPILISAICTVTKELSKGLEDLKIRGGVGTIQTTTLLRTARILRSVPYTPGGLLSRERPSTETNVKNSLGINNNNNNSNNNNNNNNNNLKEPLLYNYNVKNTRLNMTGWEKWSTGYCARKYTKWYMHIPRSIKENELHKFLEDFEKETDHLIQAKGPGLVLINKNKNKTKWTFRLVDFPFRSATEWN